ncbi:hypothetical protein GIB67_032428 [Kingdonia uniflora]|uniref:SNF2 N-terminal domain-containing protein n=1 Tax=Kingdonia uniflora TaxID=39325 RepID=A0A7J7MIU8_9MAGN|nr:hypothetical protein GIB67_032428 [Kingdonia uniflora]
MRTVGIENTTELFEKQLALEMSEMTLEEALILAKAFSHYLNLMAITETRHRYYQNFFLKYLMEFNDQPDLSHEDRDMLIEDLVNFMFDCVSGLTTSPDNYGCIMVDDMGLGKTLQSITLMYTLLRQGFDGEPLVKKEIYT